MRRKVRVNRFLLVNLAVVIMIAMILALQGPRAESAPVRGAGVGAGKLLGLHVYDDYSEKIPASYRRWIHHFKLEVCWSLVEKSPGYYDWTWLDKAINQMLSDQAESICLLLSGPIPEWTRDSRYAPVSEKAPPLNLGDWYDFCAALAQRYGPVVEFYEIWNEPGWDRDSQSYQAWRVYHYGGQVESDYLPLLQVAYDAVKKNDPSSRVMCGALLYSIDVDPAAGTELYDMLFDEVNRPGQDVSVRVEASLPLLAQQYLDFDHQGAWNGDDSAFEDTSPRTEWYFPEGRTGASIQYFLDLRNPNAQSAQVSLTFEMARGERLSRRIFLPAESRTTLDINRLIGFQGSCDLVALHPYKAFWNWGLYFYHCLQAIRAHGALQEGVVTEVGCPNSTDHPPGQVDPYSEALQNKAMGQEGVGTLMQYGCRKIWIYRDYDEDPHTAWDGAYYGLFDYLGNPHPAWDTYAQWQSRLPSYEQLPTSIP